MSLTSDHLSTSALLRAATSQKGGKGEGKRSKKRAPSDSSSSSSSSAPSLKRKLDHEGEQAGGDNAMLSELKKGNNLLSDAGLKTLFDPSQNDDESRVAMFDMLGEVGSVIQEKYSWACPDERALNILAHFSPIVEIGAGHGYWASLLRKRNVDISAYDILAPPEGSDKASKSSKKKALAKALEIGVGVSEEGGKFWTNVVGGSAEVLLLPENKNRNLFLSFPDEVSELALECLRNYMGEYIIHVGELIGAGDGTLSIEDAPWGRSTTKNFQVRTPSTPPPPTFPTFHAFHYVSMFE
jgi:hypothetical protein